MRMRVALEGGAVEATDLAHRKKGAPSLFGARRKGFARHAIAPLDLAAGDGSG